MTRHDRHTVGHDKGQHARDAVRALLLLWLASSLVTSGVATLFLSNVFDVGWGFALRHGLGALLRAVGWLTTWSIVAAFPLRVFSPSVARSDAPPSDTDGAIVFEAFVVTAILMTIFLFVMPTGLALTKSEFGLAMIGLCQLATLVFATARISAVPV